MPTCNIYSQCLLGAALNERADLRLLVLSSIRAALKIADTNDAYGSNFSHLMEQRILRQFFLHYIICW